MEGLSAIQKGVHFQLNFARTIAEYLSTHVPFLVNNRTPEELTGPVIIACTILSAVVLYFSLSLGAGASGDGVGMSTAGGPVAMPAGEGEKKEQ